MALLFAYGLHLRSGASPDSFQELNSDDAQVLISTEIGLRKLDAQLHADAIAKLFSREE